MIIIIDLDGTLTNTAHPQFKRMKDGLDETSISTIPVFEGAVEFINHKVNISYNSASYNTKFSNFA